jgi:hypothetical protein
MGQSTRAPTLTPADVLDWTGVLRFRNARPTLLEWDRWEVVESLECVTACHTCVTPPIKKWRALGDSRLAVPISGRIQLAA